MTFHALVVWTPAGGVLRARRESWADATQYLVVRVLPTHTGGKAAGFVGRMFTAQRSAPTVFPTSTILGGLRDDWSEYRDVWHGADDLGRVA